MARHRRSGRKSGSVHDLRDRINATRDLDPDRTSLMSATPADLRRSLRAEVALRRSIAEGVTQRSGATTQRSGGTAASLPAVVAQAESAVFTPAGSAGYTPADSAVPAALRRRNSLNAMARSTQSAGDPWAEHLERTYRLRRREHDRATPARQGGPIPTDATDRAITSTLRSLSTDAARPSAPTGVVALLAAPDTDIAADASARDASADDDDQRGKHRRRPLAAIRRHSKTLTLAGLIPTGLIGIAGASTGTAATALLSAHSVDLNDMPRQDAQPDVDTTPEIDTAAAPASDTVEAAPATSEPTDAGDTSAGSYLAAAANAAVAPAPVVTQTGPGGAGGPALRNLPDLPTSLKTSPLGIPPINLATYVRAERITTERNPGCNMSWELLAGIGRVESSHANDGKVDGDGNLFEPIYGLPLDGSLPGSNVIMDTDGGEYDGDAVYDRAVGPMQFIPQTWKKYATDGTGDGKADPQNLFDAAATTAAYLCDGGLDMHDPAQATRAIMRYNNSRAYATNVSAWSTAYASGIAPNPADLPRIH